MRKEEPVPLHESLELVGDDAGERWTDKAVAVSRLLGQTAAEAVDLIHAGVDRRQVGPVLYIDLRGPFVH